MSFLFNLYTSSKTNKSIVILFISSKRLLSILSGTKINIFLLLNDSNELVIILYSFPNFLLIFIDNSFIKANVGTTNTILEKFFLFMYSKAINVFPKLVGALNNKFFSFIKIFRTSTC